jgi:hypothetical protein
MNMDPAGDYTDELQKRVQEMTERLNRYSQKWADIRNAWYAFDRPLDAAESLAAAQTLGRVINAPLVTP